MRPRTTREHGVRQAGGGATEFSLENDVSRLTAEWEQLADEVGADPFNRPGWLTAWAAAFASGPLVAATLREGGQLRAVLPLVARRGRLVAPANFHTPRASLVAAGESATRELLDGTFGLSVPAIELTQVDAEAGHEPLLSACARAAGRRIVRRQLPAPPYVRVETDWATYEQGLRRKHRKEVRRLWRRLEEQGDVSFSVGDGSENLEGLLEELFTVEAMGWKGSDGTAINSTQATRRFYTQVARWAAERDWLRLVVLRLDGRPIAVDYALEHRGVWHALKGGFDPDAASFGPGVLVLHRTLEHAFDRGVRLVELNGQADAYKLNWTSLTGERAWFGAYDRSLAGDGRFAVAAGRDRLVPLAKAARSKLRA